MFLKTINYHHIWISAGTIYNPEAAPWVDKLTYFFQKIALSNDKPTYFSRKTATFSPYRSAWKLHHTNGGFPMPFARERTRRNETVWGFQNHQWFGRLVADRQRFQEAIHGTQDSERGRFRRVRSLQRNPLDPSCLFGQRRQRWLRLDESVKKNHGVNESDEDEGGENLLKGNTEVGFS